MKKLANIFLTLLLPVVILTGGCSGGSQPAATEDAKRDVSASVVLPVADYAERLTYKAFGEFVQDRFNGYHVGDDIEYQDAVQEIPVKAVADGVVVHSGNVSGYGGLIVIRHTVKNTVSNALYGHIDFSSTSLKKGDIVTKGQFLAYLGDNKSEETDGERKHLHFALYRGSDLRKQGYESSKEKISAWINPYQFFLEHNLALKKPHRSYIPEKETGGDIFKLHFIVPDGWEVEYIPSLKSLNLFTLKGSGSARERSQILIRYFDASAFLTLPTVTIHSTVKGTVGAENYEARIYDIQKKPGVPDFTDQPSWRNERHIVTDFRMDAGFTRYYGVAANPILDKEIYRSVLDSIKIVGSR